MPDRPMFPIGGGYSPTPEQQALEADLRRKYQEYLQFERQRQANEADHDGGAGIQGFLDYVAGENGTIGLEDLPFLGKFFQDPVKEGSDIGVKKLGEFSLQQGGLLTKLSFLHGIPPGILLDALTNVNPLNTTEEEYLRELEEFFRRKDRRDDGLVNMPPMWRADP